MLDAVRVIAITDASHALDFARAVANCPPGSVLIQIRDKQLDGGPLLALAEEARRHAPIAINDRLDVALATDAALLHLPEDGLALADATTLWSRAVGVSRHAVADAVAAAAAGADLVQLGHIFATPSKAAAPLGTDALTAAADALAARTTSRRTHLAAVGGIDAPDRAHAAALAGADIVSLIRAAWTGASLLPFVRAVDAGRAAR